MRKNLYLILAVLSTINLAYSFLGSNVKGDFFGYQVNIWVYRMVWVFLTFLFFRTYFILRKASTEK